MDKNGRVSVVIPTRGKIDLLEKCLSNLFDSEDAVRIEQVCIIETGGEDALELLKGPFKDKPTSWIPGREDWWYSQLNNNAVLQTKQFPLKQGVSAPITEPSEYILLLNNDCFVKPDALGHMLNVFERDAGGEDVGIVGAKLLFPDGLIQHLGMKFDKYGQPSHFGYKKANDPVYAPSQRDDYNDGVTFALALIRRELWEELGGLDERYCFNYEDADFCLRAREAGYRCKTSVRAQAVHQEGASEDHRRSFFHTVHRNLEIFRDTWITSGRLDKATNRSSWTGSGPLAFENMNLCFFPAGRGVGASWWRIEQVANKIARKKLANVDICYPDLEVPKLQQILMHADAAVFHCHFSQWLKNSLVKYRYHRNAAFVYDYDDHPVHLSPWAQAYRSLGCKEIPLRRSNGEEFWLWRDGEHGFDVERNVENRVRQLEIMSAADLLTTTTPPLYQYFKTLNQNVSILPNLLDFDIFRHQFTLWQRRSGPVRIGWHGGDNHFHDIDSIGRPLVEYVNDHDVQVVFFGAFYKGPLLGIDESKVVEEEWCNVEAFPYKLATLGIDVGIVPLADPNGPMMKFNRFKSDIKYLEYSALRVPSLVAADREPYSCVVDGVNGLTYENNAEFLEQLDRLCRDHELRATLGTAALDWVHEHRDLDKNIGMWIDTYSDLVRRYTSERIEFQAELEKSAEPAASSAAAEGSPP